MNLNELIDVMEKAEKTNDEIEREFTKKKQKLEEKIIKLKERYDQLHEDLLPKDALLDVIKKIGLGRDYRTSNSGASYIRVSPTYNKLHLDANDNTLRRFLNKTNCQDIESINWLEYKYSEYKKAKHYIDVFENEISEFYDALSKDITEILNRRQSDLNAIDLTDDDQETKRYVVKIIVEEV